MTLGSWLSAALAPPASSDKSPRSSASSHTSYIAEELMGGADNFIRSLAEENAQLRALLAKQANANLPPSPPSTATESCSSRPMSPMDVLPDPLLRRPSQAREDEDASPLRTIIELLRVQISSQAAAQDKLLEQFGDLRSSYASLQSATSDVTDELVVMRQKSARLAEEVEEERRQRRQMEEEKAAEASKVLTLRNKVEESRRAIMRLQDEAATRRNADSRRGSAVLGGSPFGLGMERRGSMQLPGSGLLENRHSRRGSLATTETPIVSNGLGVGLGLDLAGQAPIAADSHSRRASLAHGVAASSPLAGSSIIANVPGHRRAASVSQLGSKTEITDERLAAVRNLHRSASAAEGHDRRRSSLAAVSEDGPSSIRRVGSLNLPARSIKASSSARRHSSLAAGSSSSSRASVNEDEASNLRQQLEALQRRLAEVESTGSRKAASNYGGSVEGTPAHGRRPSASMSQFGAFSFQVQGRNPALMDTPPSPSGGTFSPGGTRRATHEQLGPFAHQHQKEPSSLSEEAHFSADESSPEAKSSDELVKGVEGDKKA